jgi:hypothetical protein
MSAVTGLKSSQFNHQETVPFGVVSYELPLIIEKELAFFITDRMNDLHSSIKLKTFLSSMSRET